MCGGSRHDHLVMHMRPFSDAAQNLGGLSQICVVSCHGLEMPPDMMDTGQTACLTGKRSCSEEPLSEKRARTGHCVGVHACIEEAAGDPRNPRIGWSQAQHHSQSAPQPLGMSVKLLDPSRGDLAWKTECPPGRSVIDWEMCPTPFAHVQNYMDGEVASASQDPYCNASSNDSQILPRGC